MSSVSLHVESIDLGAGLRLVITRYRTKVLSAVVMEDR
jgi:hypothetical protein